MKYLLGIDVGTTGTKTLLFRQDGKLCGQAYRPYDTQTPRVGWSEQDPEDWWNAVVATVRETTRDPEIGRNVAGISLSLQGGTMVAVDENYRPVRPAMVWNDTRCTEELARYLESSSDEEMYRKTGWHLLPGLNLMQICWMRDHEPENYAKSAMFLSVPDYISYKMTGIAAIDPSDAGINQLSNITEGRYDKALLDFAGIRESQLPPLLSSGQAIGHLTPEAAETLGLTTDAVLCAGAHDQYAVALGAGACKAGDILIGSGTCWVITCIGDQPDFDSGLSQSVAAVPEKWGSLWSLSSGGVCLEWLRKNIACGPDGEMLSYDELNRQIDSRKAAEDDLYFFPFSGRSTLEQGFSRGSFTGLDLSHDRFHMARAVMEGVAFQIVWMLDAFQTKPSREGLKLAGGASKSEVWCRILADISGLPVRVPEVADLACVGAAVLAGVGSGIFRDAEEGCKCLSVGERVIRPDPQRMQMYRGRFAHYKKCAGVLGAVYD